MTPRLGFHWNFEWTSTGQSISFRLAQGPFESQRAHRLCRRRGMVNWVSLKGIPMEGYTPGGYNLKKAPVTSGIGDSLGVLVHRGAARASTDVLRNLGMVVPSGGVTKWAIGAP